ncbi:MAG: serine/threonine-protein kinase [Myxococcota bacterium]
MTEVPKQLGGYEILAEIQSGGMATLYLAQRSGPAGFKKQVAVKVLKQHLANNQKFIEMFIDEARIAARIAHPNVVRIEELGHTEEQYFLVMEYIHGAALSEVMTSLARMERRLTPPMAVAMAMAAASGLHAAHELRDDAGQLLDVIHRDVSPQNILLGARGEMKVIDFGIAKARNRLHVTDAGAGIKGKLRYMAPEQLTGTSIDRRADVYALGVVLWEMLVMRRLFQGQTDPQVIQRVTQGDMPPPGAFVDLAYALDGAVLEALSRDPSGRPATARDFRRKLKDALPEANAIDRGEMAALLWALRGDSLRKRAERLPGVAAMLQNIELDLTPEEALQRFTEPVSEAFHDAETRVGFATGTGSQEATRVTGHGAETGEAPRPQMGTGGGESLPATRVGRPAAKAAAAKVSATAPSLSPKKSSNTMKLALTVVLAILIGAAATAIVLGVFSEREEPPPVQVVPAPPG